MHLSLDILRVNVQGIKATSHLQSLYSLIVVLDITLLGASTPTNMLESLSTNFHGEIFLPHIGTSFEVEIASHFSTRDSSQEL